MRWISVAASALGVWLSLAPFILGYAASASGWSDMSVGLTIAVMAGWAAVTQSSTGAVTLSSFVALAGFWIAISSFMFMHLPPERVVWNDVMTGIVVLVLGGARAFSPGVTARSA